MPLYQYDCTACTATLERRQSFSEPPLEACPDCGGRLRKAFHAVGIIFKGSGWYCTDSRPSRGEDGKPKESGDTKAA